MSSLVFSLRNFSKKRGQVSDKLRTDPYDPEVKYFLSFLWERVFFPLFGEVKFAE